MPSFALVFFAEILHGFTAGIVTPAIAAISLGLVGRRAMAVRTGRNYRFNALMSIASSGARSRLTFPYRGRCSKQLPA
jgi:hypothetical protein